MIGRPVLVSFVVAVGLLTAAILLQFNNQLDRAVAYFQLADEKRLIETTLTYLREEYQRPQSAEQSRKVQEDYDFVKRRQAYIWLFDAFQEKIKNRMVAYSILLAASLFALDCALYYVFIRRLERPLARVVESLRGYSRDRRIVEARVEGTRSTQALVRQFNSVLAELRERTLSQSIRDSVENWQGSARVILHEVKNG